MRTEIEHETHTLAHPVACLSQHLSAEELSVVYDSLSLEPLAYSLLIPDLFSLGQHRDVASGFLAGIPVELSAVLFPVDI